MIEIVKHGKKRKPEFQITCYRCECEFTFNTHDIVSYCSLTDPIYVICPDCSTWNRAAYAKKVSQIKKNMI